jgi:hypothetical protein
MIIHMLYIRNIILILVVILGIIHGILHSILHSIYTVLPATRQDLPIYLPGMVNSRVLLLTHCIFK